MKILLDECVNRRIARLLTGHDVAMTSRMGWSGVKNGQLLARAVGAEFEVFLTLDRNLSFQNHIASFPIAVLVLTTKSNRMADLSPLVPDLLSALAIAVPGTVTYLGA